MLGQVPDPGTRLSSTGETMQVHRFHSPFKHWVSGLLAEVAAFALFILGLFLMAVAITWVF